MVTPLSGIRDQLTKALNEAFERQYAEDEKSWAVFYTYYHDTMETKVYEVRRWDWDKDHQRSGLDRVYAKDELDAYMQVMKKRGKL